MNRSSFLCRVWASLVGLSMAVIPARATAQPATAQAEALFRDGKALMADGNYAAACEAFEGSYAKGPAVSTLLNLADCREKNQQYASAWGAFVEAGRKAREVTDGAALVEVAQRRAAALEPRLSYLTISVPADARIDGLVITRNGAVVDPYEWNRALPVDGGTYRIEAKAPAREPWSTTVTVGNAKDKQSVDVPRFGDVAPTVTPVGPASSAGDGGATPDDRAGGGRGHRTLALGLGGVGLVGLGGALGLELWSRSTYDDAKAVVNTDLARSHSLTDDANRQRHLAIASGVVGVAALGVGAYLWFAGAGGAGERTAVLVPTADGARVLVRGSF